MNGSDQTQPVALREWAVAVKALKEGKQIIVMRKGGIAEETRDFQLISPSFYLLPGFEHQKPELLKEEYRGGVDESLADWQPERGSVPVSVFAEVAEDIEIRDQETLDRLRGFHIWTDAFAEERLKWKKTKPLHVLLLKVYAADSPVEIPLRDSYSGCKSWVRLKDSIPGGSFKPVLTDEQFREAAEKIKEALSR